MSEHIYICIDLKSFYASCECVKLGLDPLKTNLVVADVERTEKTICLAVTPPLKSYGIKGRCRLFEVNERIEEINRERIKNIPEGKFRGKSSDFDELSYDDSLKVDFLIARPNMSYYIEESSKIYNIYLKYVSKDDIHVYSIDEVFIDVTKYLKNMKTDVFTFSKKILKDVYNETKITATLGIGTNMFLAKVAMDIMAKKIVADEDGARIAFLDEEIYKKELWNYKPLSSFWRIGSGYSKRLEKLGLFTMGDIAKCSLGGAMDYYNEDLLYKEFGVNAEILIDHAWGVETVTIEDIKAYKPKSTSMAKGQVLSCGYEMKKAKLVVKEMIDLMALDLVSKGILTNHITLSIGYDIESKNYNEYEIDRYQRKIPKSSHGSINLDYYTSSSKILMKNAILLFERITKSNLLVKRINISFDFLKDESILVEQYEQLSLFSDENKLIDKEKDLQKAILHIKEKYGKNSILKGMNLEEGATTKERNEEIGGHRA